MDKSISAQGKVLYIGSWIFFVVLFVCSIASHLLKHEPFGVQTAVLLVPSALLAWRVTTLSQFACVIIASLSLSLAIVFFFYGLGQFAYVDGFCYAYLSLIAVRRAYWAIYRR
jgi:hypothetical protein